ncbi:glycosyltransferase family 2 protein [Candidatus Absconditicoccus praedator]|uniref:glycosyltransferase family 2 protein n=1 Tax=Candidatus Absconditicoccus praedator TaxID=2735562 RepID=UPI001E5F05EC|nr:glycosyltransferase family 2 protein [Candidatus Absconditicoccus praedator]UFX83019.1 glycosyltransferase family 2 protein [Candidatus Absconditicoccus praedator]
MKFEVVIPSRGSIGTLQKIVESIVNSNVLPSKVHIIIDKFIGKDEYDIILYFIFKKIEEEKKQIFNIITNLNSNLCPGVGVSYIRNFGINLCKSEYMYIIDDDNIFGENFFKETIESYSKYQNNFEKEIFLSPTIMYRQTNKIQSQGFKKISPFLAKVVPTKSTGDYSTPKLIGGNSIFGKTNNFKKIMFDEYFEFIYEDLDFSWRATNLGYKIVVDNNLKTNHMEKEKSATEKSFIGTPKTAYQKSRNRIILIKNNAKWWEKYIFYISGLWIQTGWFIFLVLFLGKHSKFETFKSILKGTYEGIKF